jgi:hypothetical protein
MRRTASRPVARTIAPGAVGLLLLSISAGAGAAGPAEVLDVSPDGRETAEQTAATVAPGRLLFRADVPLPAGPDWQGDLERAVGGLAFGDVDGDEDLDLVSGCYDASSSFPPITVYRNLVYLTVDGTLETTPSWTSDDQRHTGKVRFGDADGDGLLDLLSTNGGQSLHPSVIYLNGAGGIDTTPDWTAGDATWTLNGAFGDVDADGDLDLVTANQGNTFVPTRPVHLFRNLGGGLETTPSWASADSAISNAVGLADLDGSSLVTVVGWTAAGDGSTKIFRVPHVPVHAFHRVEITGSDTPHPVTLDRSTGRIHFASPPAVGTTVEVDYTHATLPDAAFTRWSGYETCVYGNLGGGFSMLPTWDTGDPSRTDKGLGFSDVDGDGDADLAHGASGDPTVLYRNDGGALVGPTWSSTNSYHGTQDLAWGDVDGDGDEDLATIEFGNGHVRVYLNRDGALDSEPSWFYDLSSSGTAIAWGDVNGDGALDLAAGTAREPVVLFLNDGPPGVDVPEIAAAAEAEPTLRLTASPNPARGGIAIRVAGAAGIARDPSGVVIEILDAAGRAVAEVTARPAGSDLVARWDGRDRAGRSAPAGVYFLRAEWDGRVHSGRVTRLR